MSFPDYLRGRISEDYKNLIIQKLEEVKNQSETMKSKVSPSIFEANQGLLDRIQREIGKIQETISSELNQSHEKISSQINSAIEESMGSWYHSDVSPFHQQLELLISDIVSNIPPAPKKENADIASLRDLMKKLDGGATQSEILNITLQHISGWVSRAVLFVVKGEQANGWASMGLGANWDANKTRSIKVDLSQDNVLRAAVTSGQAAFGSSDQFSENGALFESLDGPNPASAMAFPIMVRGKMAGILYADTKTELSEQPDLLNLLHLASLSAGWAIDLLPTKPKQAPKPVEAVQAPVTAPISNSAPIPVEVESEVETGSLPTVAINMKKAPAFSSIPEPEEASGTVMMPAIPFRTEPIGDEDQKLHEDAKRFARLLVSEIKLYNEAQVSAGREHKDLYERLKDDIERSRKMYMDRVPSHISEKTNYFYEELVRTLANGDPTLLGM